MYTLALINKQGGSDTTHHDSKASIVSKIKEWSDPQNLTARIWDEQGNQLFDDVATKVSRNFKTK